MKPLAIVTLVALGALLASALIEPTGLTLWFLVVAWSLSVALCIVALVRSRWRS